MKLLATLLKDQLVSVAVRGDFMAAGSGFFHQVRKALADPAEKEARDLHVAIAEDVEQVAKILFDVRRQPRPRGDRRSGGQVQDVEPIFDVYGEIWKSA